MKTMNREIHTLQVGDTTLEYTVIGKGIPILLLHGGHSGCQEVFGYERLLESGFSIITPSRAGYGRTTPVMELIQACSLYKELLDHLSIDHVHVMAISAGGPSGILFCSLFPARVSSFTLQCAVTKPWLTPADQAYRAGMRIFNPNRERGTWRMLAVFSNLFPKLMFRLMASSFSNLPYSEVKQRIDKTAIEEFRKMNNRQRSHSGFLIDLKHTQHDYSKEMANIQAPTLIMHSKNDRTVPLSHAEYAKAYIPQAEQCILDSWGHLIWIGKHAVEYDDALVLFLKRQEQ